MRGSRASALGVAALVAAGACFQAPGPALPCSPDLACPSGMTCIAGACQAATIGDASAASDGAVGAADAGPDGSVQADSDGDGIADAVDVCPMVRDPRQDDEDQDRIGDLCDRCPHRAAGLGGDLDADGDGVGDACDPGPEAHEWAYFTGFAVNDGQWSWTSGAWAVAGGALVQSQATTTTTSARLPASLFTGPGATLTLGGRVTAVGGTGRYLWVSIGEDAAASTYLTCAHNSPTSGAPDVAIEQYLGGSYNAITTVPAATLELGGFEVVAQTEPAGANGVVRCTVALASGQRLTLSTVAPQPTVGARGVFVEDLAIAIDWAAVVRRR